MSLEDKQKKLNKNIREILNDLEHLERTRQNVLETLCRLIKEEIYEDNRQTKKMGG